MIQQSTMWRHLVYYGFLAACTCCFCLSCCGFLVYRLFIKPLAFGVILLAMLPMTAGSMLLHHFHTLAEKKDKKDNISIRKA